ncbi:hypothetical protein D3C86_1750770 [compost metagenome]
MILTLCVNEVLIGNSAVTQSAPSFSGGRNSVPSQRVEITVNPKESPAINKVSFLRLKVHLNPRSMVLFTKRVKKFSFSRTFFFSRMELKTGTSVRVKINAPSKAKPSVHANGENIFPSTFSKAKIGSKAEMMISLEKKIAFPI